VADKRRYGFRVEATCRYCRDVIIATIRREVYICKCGALEQHGEYQKYNKPTIEVENV